MIKKIILYSLIIFSLLADSITEFNSRIEVQQDGSLIVTEIINFKFDAYKRGIFRDFPTDYKDAYGNKHRVSFKVLDIKKDGHSENCSVSRYLNGYRLLIGNSDKYLSPGNYSYEIKYQTNRQVGFFKNHDELYWNVTGNGWPVIINKAKAEVILPQNITIEKVEAYTGRYGQSYRNYLSNFHENIAKFETTKYLLPNEGLTTVVGWPKGFIKEQTFIEKVKYFFEDNIEILFFVLFILLILSYYIFFWFKFCRISKKTIIPLFESPDNLLPAEIAYIINKSYSNQCLSASLVDMAVKGSITIERENTKYISHKYILKRVKESTIELYENIFDKLFKSHSEIKITDSNSNIFNKIISYCKNNLSNKFDKLYINFNYRYFGFGLILTIILSASYFFLGQVSILAIFLLAILVLINIIFYFVLQTYTESGQRVYEQILGFKMFLSFTEKERLKYLTNTEQTPQEYETFLPYAMALGVEVLWTKQFSGLFERMAKEGVSYVPLWYYGYRGQFYPNFSSFSNSFTQSISSSTYTPGSKSGFSGGKGGGFSGGGGGGGGGGSW